MSGKGSRPRPVDAQTYAREWERIFTPTNGGTMATQRVLQVTPQTDEPCKSVVYIRADTIPVVFDDHQVFGIMHSRLAVGTLEYGNGEPTFTPDETQPYIPEIKQS